MLLCCTSYVTAVYVAAANFENANGQGALGTVNSDTGGYIAVPRFW